MKFVSYIFTIPTEYLIDFLGTYVTLNNIDLNERYNS